MAHVAFVIFKRLFALQNKGGVVASRYRLRSRRTNSEQLVSIGQSAASVSSRSTNPGGSSTSKLLISRVFESEGNLFISTTFNGQKY